MSGSLPISRANTRSAADGFGRCRFRLASVDSARRLQPVRVWQAFQSLPANHHYRLTCGRLCASPSYPPAPFSSRHRPARSSRGRGRGADCRQSASPRCTSAANGVTRRHLAAMLPLIELLAQGAQNESSKANSFDNGSGLCRSDAVGLQSCGNNLPLGFFDGGNATALNPHTLTFCRRLPAHSAPRSRFACAS